MASPVRQKQPKIKIRTITFMNWSSRLLCWKDQNLLWILIPKQLVFVVQINCFIFHYWRDISEQELLLLIIEGLLQTYAYISAIWKPLKHHWPQLKSYIYSTSVKNLKVLNIITERLLFMFCHTNPFPYISIYTG